MARSCSLVLILSALTLYACTTEDPSEIKDGRDATFSDVGSDALDDVSSPPGLTIPVTLTDLPPDAEAPWPDGSIVHGALLTVDHVIDGDTLYVSTGSGTYDRERVRLLGIDAPECDKRRVGNGQRECDPDRQDFSGDAEPFGVEAWQTLRTLVDSAPAIRLACRMDGETCEIDRYGRYLAWVVVGDRLDASEHMLARGLALTYTSFPVENLAAYCQREDEAIAQGLGLWADGFDAALNGMNASTLSWYTYRNSKCREAQTQ